MDILFENLWQRSSDAIAHFWQTRDQQAASQRLRGGTDQGTRSAVTGGAQMDGFIGLVRDLVVHAGIDASHIFYRKRLELPGYFRPTKEWDLLVVRNGQLILVVEAKSQVGP
jgi:hypothetical protein